MGGFSAVFLGLYGQQCFGAACSEGDLVRRVGPREAWTDRVLVWCR